LNSDDWLALEQCSLPLLARLLLDWLESLSEPILSRKLAAYALSIQGDQDPNQDKDKELSLQGGLELISSSAHHTLRYLMRLIHACTRVSKPSLRASLLRRFAFALFHPQIYLTSSTPFYTLRNPHCSLHAGEGGEEDAIAVVPAPCDEKKQDGLEEGEQHKISGRDEEQEAGSREKSASEAYNTESKEAPPNGNPAASSASSSSDYSFIALERLGSYLGIMCREWESVVRPHPGVGVNVSGGRSLPPVSLKKTPSHLHHQANESLESPPPPSARSIVLAPVMTKKTLSSSSPSPSQSRSIKIRTRSLQGSTDMEMEKEKGQEQHQSACEQIQRLFATLPLALQSQLVEQLQHHVTSASQPPPSHTHTPNLPIHHGLVFTSPSSLSTSPRKPLTLLSSPPRSSRSIGYDQPQSNSDQAHSNSNKAEEAPEREESKELTQAQIQDEIQKSPSAPSQDQDENGEVVVTEAEAEAEAEAPIDVASTPRNEAEVEDEEAGTATSTTTPLDGSDEKSEAAESQMEMEMEAEVKEQENKQSEEAHGDAVKSGEAEESKEEQLEGQEQQGGVILKYNISRRLHKLSHVPNMPDLGPNLSTRNGTLPPLSTRRLIVSSLDDSESVNVAPATSSGSASLTLTLEAETAGSADDNANANVNVNVQVASELVLVADADADDDVDVEAKVVEDHPF